MTALAQRVILAWGWQRCLCACLAGAVGALAMPPFGILPALAVSLTIAVWLIDGAAAGQRYRTAATLLSAAVAGWWWGFGYFVAGLWWLGAAFLVEAEQFAWALPFGVIGLPALLAFFPAFGFALARLLWSPGGGRLFAVAFGLTASEWLRGTLFTGFPWNTLGMALGQNAWLMQSASIVGLYGLTVLAIVICAAPATLGTGAPRIRLLAPALAVACLAGLALFGAWRIPEAPAPLVAGVKLRIMQPNLQQDAKFGPENRDEIMRHYLRLSDRATSPQSTGVADATHLVWPESAFPFLLHRDPAGLAQLAALLPPGTVLITGAAREGEPEPGGTTRRFHNSIHVVADDGTIIGTYDKVHLVPFGEYFPHFLDSALRGLGIRQFVQIPGGFDPGERRVSLPIPGLPPVAATICYEAIFPGAIVGPGSPPGLILNVTNDAWFGNTPGPYQHFAQARLRAIEEGLPLVRAANTGISAVVDAHGRVVGSLPLGIEGVLDMGLPAAIPPPAFARVGNALVVALVLCCWLAALIARRAPRRRVFGGKAAPVPERAS
ncbi:MAG TPA: apolipoprotein N-acyltransferase [Beijerinckiaceae bacterium]|jgi:apolipoprotein N-acyltransferase